MKLLIVAALVAVAASREFPHADIHTFHGFSRETGELAAENTLKAGVAVLAAEANCGVGHVVPIRGVSAASAVD